MFNKQTQEFIVKVETSNTGESKIATLTLSEDGVFELSVDGAKMSMKQTHLTQAVNELVSHRTAFLRTKAEKPA